MELYGALRWRAVGGGDHYYVGMFVDCMVISYRIYLLSLVLCIFWKELRILSLLLMVLRKTWCHQTYYHAKTLNRLEVCRINLMIDGAG